MNERDRLTSLIDEGYWLYENRNLMQSMMLITEKIADYLLKEGILAPPCKIGDPIYEVIFRKKNKASHILEEKVVGIHIIDAPQDLGHNRKNYIITHNKNTNQIRHIGFDKIGKSVFFSKADANKLLEEERNGES